MALLFEYAQLMTVGKALDARVPGVLRRRPGGDGAAQFVPGPDMVCGQLKELTGQALKALDRTESPEYTRVPVVAINAQGEQVDAFAYAYLQADFQDFPLIPSGRWRKL